jgi:hypothetical protein
LAYYSDNELDYDDGLVEEEVIERAEGVPVPPAHNFGERGQSGHPQLGNQTILENGRGYRWVVRDEIRNDNFAHRPRQQPYWKWQGENAAGPHSFYDYWFDQIKYAQLDEWVKYTNIELHNTRQQRPTNIYIYIYILYERRRGGVEGCFSARVFSSSSSASRTYTIFEGGDYESRFEMSKSRYKELTAAFLFNEPQANTVDKVLLLRGCL